MAFKKLQFDDQSVSLLQDNIADALQNNTKQLERVVTGGRASIVVTDVGPPFVGGNLSKASLTSGQDNLVAHGLKRIPTVWTVMKLDANANVWEVDTTTLATKTQDTRSASETYLNLWCSASCNVVVWIN